MIFYLKNLMIIHCLLMSIFMNCVKASDYMSEQKLLPSDLEAYDNFGSSVSISGDYAIIGASDANSTGSAYIFKFDRDIWVEKEKISPSDGAIMDYFGCSVSISGGYAIVGAKGNDDAVEFSGSAYIFKKDGGSWLEHNKLLASDLEKNDNFGESVSISGYYAVIGAPGDYENSGSVYIFKRDGASYIEQAKLYASDWAEGHLFGGSVSIDGDYVIIGAYEASAAYIFKRNGEEWVEQTKLVGPDGYSVSIDEDYAIVGSLGENSAYIFKRLEETWVEHTKLVSPNIKKDSWFGCSVSISDDYAIVGASKEISNNYQSGAAYIYKQEEEGAWVKKTKIFASDGATDDYFSNSISIDGDYFIIGAELSNEKGEDSGSANIFKFPYSFPQIFVSPTSKTVPAGSGSLSFNVFNDIVKMNWTAKTDVTWITLKNSSNTGDGTLNISYSSYGLKKRIGTITISADVAENSPQTIKVTQGSFYNEQKILPSDVTEVDKFVQSVSITGDYAIVGSKNSAYIFKIDGDKWIEESKLIASDYALENNNFGTSVSISGDYVIVGADYDSSKGYNSGSAYLFKKDGDTWIEQAKLHASDAAVQDFFGKSVSISGDYAIVGTHFGSAAYIFRKDGSIWVEEAKLLSYDGTKDDNFGKSVSISGNYAIIGAQKDSVNGSAYIYKRIDGDGGIWIEQAKLHGSSFSHFGKSVSISGDYAIVGEAGLAYVFKRDEDRWIEQAKLHSYDDTKFYDFGNSVSISGNNAIVGTTVGVYIFRREGGRWIEKPKLYTCGDLVSIYDGYAIVGESNSGSVYIYNLPGYFPQILTVSCNSKTVNRDTGYLSFNIFNLGNKAEVMNWTAITDVSWLTLKKSSGMGNGTLNISYATNSMTERRIGTITITSKSAINSPQTIEVTQEGLYNDQKLISSDYPKYNNFGRSVSISGDYAIIGTNGSGSAYIFKKDGDIWLEHTKLFASDGAEYECFGKSVAISGDYAIVGTYKNSAYIFMREKNRWIEQAKLLPSDFKGYDFGISVSISRDYAIVGASSDSDNGINSGSAYIFGRDGNRWIEQAKLYPSEATKYDKFGLSVSISGDYAIVGRHGSAHIFMRDSDRWIEQTKLVPSEAEACDILFGESVSISGDYVIVGAVNGHGNISIISGTAYIFKKNGDRWIEQAKLIHSDAEKYDHFGESVSISGDYALVGAKNKYDEFFSGSAYIFKRNGDKWIEQAKLLASDTDATTGDFYSFGSSVSISGENVIVGTEKLNYAYIFSTPTKSINQGDINGDNIVDLKDLQACQQVLIGKTPYPFYLKGADFNKNGRLEIGDQHTLLRIITGQRDL